MRRSLLDWKPRGHGASKNEKENEKGKENGKARKGFSKVHFITLNGYYKYTLKLWENQSQNLQFLSLFLRRKREACKINYL
jgi:hypothetical protein